MRSARHMKASIISLHILFVSNFKISFSGRMIIIYIPHVCIPGELFVFKGVKYD